MKPLVALALAALAACRQGSSIADDQPDAAPRPGQPDAKVCHNDLVPAARQCADPLGSEIELAVVAKPLQFETDADASEPLAVALHFGWEEPQTFPIDCAPLARLEIAAGALASFPAMPARTVSGVLAPAVTGAGIVPSINDQRLPLPCPMNRCTVGSEAAPLRLRVLSRATRDAWLAHPGLARCNAATHGLAVVTYRDRARRPLAGVVPQQWYRIVIGGPPTRDLVAGDEVFFLAADRRTLEARTSTSESGTVVIPLVESVSMEVTGRAAGITFEPLGIAAVAGTVYFEQIDPQGG